ncbi:NAD-glutamate dehydrogenase [Halioglobus sp. HI00S01]|uniref:NAD-glutamate dehydrogenase n=1 Tax=Halioglobus sp. HI00S01 TaxID=1822214 RepID=UPI0007C3F6C1|nr:NAD-glutamate dehydrogenase [Halioglobus sp. HI00S01]KZX58779.1 NAD-glutamate dehydrogenase [Halioglobus sp. HI00S01]
MTWENHKKALLDSLERRIDDRAESADKASLKHLSSALLRRLSAEDLHGTAVENLYGCTYQLLEIFRHWDGEVPKVEFFNPQLHRDGWESTSTILAILCPGIPFVTASVRGELNRRNLPIHIVASTNVVVERDANGELQEILGYMPETPEGASSEAIIYFELGRRSDPSDMSELRQTLLDILGEVMEVVTDFPAMNDQLESVVEDISCSDCVEAPYRDEATAFLVWLREQHMTMLGYEYLEVTYKGSTPNISVAADRSLGLLRHRGTRGVADLQADLASMSLDELQHRQLSFSKSRNRSRVHRLTYPDYVEARVFDEQGRVIGQHRFIGLYTSSVYTTHPKFIPILRRKVAAIMDMSHVDWAEHETRELSRVLEMYPRDELFQSNIADLNVVVNAINRIQERRQTRLFVRRDAHGKFVSCIVFVPRDRYTTELREQIGEILTRAYDAEESEFTTQFSESILVRSHFVLRVDPANPIDCDPAELEEELVQATLAWEDRLRNRLVEEFGEELGNAHANELGGGFPPGYRDDCDPRMAVADIRKILPLAAGKSLELSLYRLAEDSVTTLRLRLYHRGQSLPLSDVLPILENLGLRVTSERPYEIRSRDGERFWVQEFTVHYSLSQDFDLDDIKEEFEDAFARIWFGEAESDSFNRLLIGTRLSWREIAMLRAYARYLRQLQFPFSVEYIAETMASHLHITARIVEMFLTRFSPVFDGDEDWRAEREMSVEQRILEMLDEVQNLGQDRIIRQYLKVIKATLRTNFFQQEADGSLKPYMSFKLSPAAIPDVPQPIPMFEIYVYSPRVEGVHLRGGRVARGGLRWSDRQEDFRTEVLGLVKAQQVKNAVIVPVGAKGGFVARQLNGAMSREEVQEEGIACYRMFIRGLLDLTDNRGDIHVIRPPHVVAKDEDDPYLVVAADKGTATFSDIANQISADYDFWLGDAFASGGSVGYDHKKMGITARGAWVSVQRHFREMGVDVQSTDFTVVGVGDMAGDVFGNGMLLSEHIKLVAAFNHMHIFIDPNPDPASSYAERKRLFGQPRSAWSDYDTTLISEGGGVFLRSAKSIAISAQMRELFDISDKQLTPNELIGYLLRAPVDLLWNGGIGTYVKASSEAHVDVGDKANDGVRVNGDELRCRVVGEGGNLGMTQLGRVEYGLSGGRSNTDFIDNAGGVDCSDHEVNIKILLNAVVARGDLTEKQRNALLEKMTDDVADLVLHNNYRQVQSISLAEMQAGERFEEYLRFMETMEEMGRLDRALEFLPSAEDMLERRSRGQPLTRPELSVLISYSKGVLKEELIASDLGRDPYLANAVVTAFPAQLVDAYPEDIRTHRLHREIMCTQVANDIVNRMGLNFILRLRKATGASIADVARAFTTVMEVFNLRELWDQIEAMDHEVSAEVQQDMMLRLIRLVKRASRWLLRNRRHDLAPTPLIAEFRPGLAELRETFRDLLRGRVLEQYEEIAEHYLGEGVDETVAHRVAGNHLAYTALGIIQAAKESGAPLTDVASLYYAMGDQLELDWFGNQILGAKVTNEWQALARDTYLEDLEWQQRTLAVGALHHLPEDRNLLTCLSDWAKQEQVLLSRWQEMLAELHATEVPDFAMFAVANRELLDLAQSSVRAAMPDCGNSPASEE